MAMDIGKHPCEELDTLAAPPRWLSLISVLTSRWSGDDSNPADPNAIAIFSNGRQRLGYIAREVARVLASLIDQPDPPAGPVSERAAAGLGDRSHRPGVMRASGADFVGASE